MRPLILATAGHIDHGKTALVRALTGVDTDRLPEEKKRGITIDLGFAQLRLGELSFGVVDVPGHEGFIRNMLAGATGMDAVLMVVAADEGVMPQTREHLAILDLLGIASGVVAITKSDLVDADWLELVVDDVRRLIDTTTLQGCPIVAVSARTGAGIDELRDEIVQQAKRPELRRREDLFRMPIDRVFTVRGTGTVVTGTVWSGSITTDEPIVLRPGGLKARIRGIQVHGEAVHACQAGERAALALAGIDKDSITRGHVALDQSAWSESRMLVVRARLIEDTGWLLKTRQRVRVHLGTAEVLGRVVLLDAPQLAHGESAWVQLRLEQPVVARVGDRVVLRSYSPVTTIAGGTVAELSPAKRTRLQPRESALLRRIIEAASDQAIVAALELRGVEGASSDELAVATPYSPPEIATALENGSSSIVRMGAHCFAADVVKTVYADLLEQVRRLHEAQPLRPMLERAEIRNGIRNVPAELTEHLIESAVAQGDLTAEGGNVAVPGFKPMLTDRQVALKSAVLDALKGGGIAPPTVAELGRSLGDAREVQRLLRVLEHEGSIRPVSQDLYIEVSALVAAQERTRSAFGGLEGLTAAEFRTALPVSRKHLIPLLEYFDRTGITVRNGDLRRVVRTSEKG